MILRRLLIYSKRSSSSRRIPTSHLIICFILFMLLEMSHQSLIVGKKNSNSTTLCTTARIYVGLNAQCNIERVKCFPPLLCDGNKCTSNKFYPGKQCNSDTQCSTFSSGDPGVIVCGKTTKTCVWRKG
jgi:hypothetical protein